MTETNISLSKYRLEQALEDYNTAVVNHENGFYRAATNRAYYSVFHSMRSLLILSGQDFKKHSAVISAFRKDYIKTGIFDSNMSDIISYTSELRNDSDYEDMVYITEEEAKKLIDNAKVFYDIVKPYVEKLIAEKADNQINTNP